MQKIATLIEKYFSIVLFLALLGGLFLPGTGIALTPTIKPVLMTMLFLTSLKINFKQVFSYLKKPALPIYIFITKMLIIPTAVFLIMKYIDPTLAIGLLLLSATHPAMASPVLTELFKGNIALSLVILVTCSLLSPLTMPFLFKALTSQSIELNSIGIAKTLAFMIFTPIILSEIIKKIRAVKPLKEKSEKYFSAINIILMATLMWAGIAPQANTFLYNPLSIIRPLIALILLFTATHIVGYMIAFWRKKEDRIAISTSLTYMNNSLAFVIAVEFFPPEIVLITIISQLVWNTFPGLFKLVISH